MSGINILSVRRRPPPAGTVLCHVRSSYCYVLYGTSTCTYVAVQVGVYVGLYLRTSYQVRPSPHFFPFMLPPLLFHLPFLCFPLSCTLCCSHTCCCYSFISCPLYPLYLLVDGSGISRQLLLWGSDGCPSSSSSCQCLRVLAYSS